MPLSICKHLYACDVLQLLQLLVLLFIPFPTAAMEAYLALHFDAEQLRFSSWSCGSVFCVLHVK